MMNQYRSAVGGLAAMIVMMTTMTGCVAGSEVEVPSPPDGGSICSDSDECAAGEECQGDVACGGAPWRCGPAGNCNLDLVAYCGCDGVTFHGSSTCPGRPFAHRGGCEI